MVSCKECKERKECKDVVNIVKHRQTSSNIVHVIHVALISQILEARPWALCAQLARRLDRVQAKKALPSGRWDWMGLEMGRAFSERICGQRTPLQLQLDIIRSYQINQIKNQRPSTDFPDRHDIISVCTAQCPSIGLLSKNGERECIHRECIHLLDLYKIIQAVPRYATPSVVSIKLHDEKF